MTSLWAVISCCPIQNVFLILLVKTRLLLRAAKPQPKHDLLVNSVSVVSSVNYESICPRNTLINTKKRKKKSFQKHDMLFKKSFVNFRPSHTEGLHAFSGQNCIYLKLKPSVLVCEAK